MRTNNSLLLCTTFVLGLITTAVAVSSDRSPLDIEIQSLTGESTTLNQIRKGKPLYVKVWASWCDECMQQMPHFNHTYTQYKDTLSTVSVNLWMNETQQSVNNVIKTHHVKVPTYIDKRGVLGQKLNLSVTPTHALFDSKGKLVHLGHKASRELDEKISLLATGSLPTPPFVKKKDKAPLNKKDHSLSQAFKNKALSSVLFTSTWCDWYLKDRRPEIAKNCAAAQEFFNVHAKHNKNSLIITSHLWTGAKDIVDYREKFKPVAKVVLDANNQAFVEHNIRQFPTLLLFKNGKEVYREIDFSDTQRISNKMKSF
ncbi:MAG: redoxin family protein [Agarilytica sp.]